MNDLLILGVTGGLFFLLLSGSLIYFVFMYRQRQRYFELERQQQEVHYSRILLQSEVEIKEEALKFVSRELHDNVGQLISVVKLNLHSLPVDISEDVKAKIYDTKELVSTLYQEVKLLSSSLNARHIFTNGIIGALKFETERINRSGLIRASIEGDELLPIQHKDEILIFRMCQEVLSNSIQHSRATGITIRVKNVGDHGFISIRDDGYGFSMNSLEEEPSSRGNGIKNIQERASLIGAKANFRSSPRGTLFTVEFSLNT